MNILRIKSGYGAKNLAGIKSSANTRLSIYFGDIEVQIRTDSRGNYFFNEKHEHLPMACLQYENVSILSNFSASIIPIYGDLSLSNECSAVFMDIMALDLHTNEMKPIRAEIDKGRIWLSYYDDGVVNGSTMSYVGIV